MNNLKIALLLTLLVVTMPLWILPGAIWCICTGRTLRSCNAEANALSGMEEPEESA